MAMSKNSSKTINVKNVINAIFPYRDFLYILQLEDYYTFRYIKWLPKFYFRRGIEHREQLKLTSRALITLAISLTLTLIMALVPFNPNALYLNIVSTVISVILIPVTIGITNLLTTPVYNLAKFYYQYKAKRLIATNPDLIIVGIAGSFGKTSTKNFTNELLKYNYKTQIIPGNISFPIGIANWILNKFDKTSQVLIFETDGYKLGEVKSVCQMLPPDYAVITTIGDQHLERLGSRKTLAKTLFELIENAKPTAKIVLNEKTEKEFEKLGVYLKAKTNRQILYATTPSSSPKSLLTEQVQNLALANTIARALNIPARIINDTNAKVTTPDRRGNISIYHGFETLDASYNISATTSKAAIKNAKEFAHNRKLIVVTAGIPELGKENAEANKELGTEIAKSADEIYLLRSDFYSEIIEGINAGPVNKITVTTGKNMGEFHAWLDTKENKEKYFLLLLPELTDLYY